MKTIIVSGATIKYDDRKITIIDSYKIKNKKTMEKILMEFRQIIKQEYMIYESRLAKAEQSFYYNKIKKYE